MLQYREEVITAKVGREHIEDTLKSEMMFLKDQVVAEQQERANTEETLNNEISNLQEQLGKLLKSLFVVKYLTNYHLDCNLGISISYLCYSRFGLV